MSTFLGIPERWLDDPTWKCVNGHVSKRFLKSEARGADLCLACFEPVRLCDPNEREVVMIPDEIIEKAARALNYEAGRLRGLTMEDDWDSITEGERGGWRLCARAALEAVEADLWEARR